MPDKSYVYTVVHGSQGAYRCGVMYRQGVFIDMGGVFIDGEGLPAIQLLELAESVFKKTCGKTVEAANYGSFRRVHVLPVTFFSSPSGCPPHSRGGTMSEITMRYVSRYFVDAQTK